jgi:putative transposase
VARIARVIAAGTPYHVTHRGNHRSDVFFDDADRAHYLALLAQHAKAYAMEVWAYCLMTNHVHLIVVGHEPHSLARAIGFAHMRHSRRINQRLGWTGHLWANRFYSTALDGEHLWGAVRYVERNPVRAGLVTRAEDYAWSSARAHARRQPDALLAETRPFPGPVDDWPQWLASEGDEALVAAIRRNTCTGRPSGSEAFVKQLEERLKRVLRPMRAGRKPRGADAVGADDLTSGAAED